MAHMQPEVIFCGYFAVETTMGTEYVPDFVTSRLAAAPAEYFLDYLEGTPLDPDEMVEMQDGWLARMSAPGFLDCTDWTVHESEEAAYQYLNETYGDDA